MTLPRCPETSPFRDGRGPFSVTNENLAMQARLEAGYREMKAGIVAAGRAVKIVLQTAARDAVAAEKAR